MRLAATGALLALSLAVSACSNRDEYTQKVLDEFREGCVGAATKQLEGADAPARAASYCDCVVEKMKKDIPFKEFNALFLQNGKLESPKPETVEQMAAIMAECQESTIKRDRKQ